VVTVWESLQAIRAFSVVFVKLCKSGQGMKLGCLPQLILSRLA
jgi:hypothetical protein